MSESSEETALVFVFGTLKRGYGNGERYLSKAEFLGEAISVEGNYIMQDVGFPTLWQTPRITKKAGRVAGEIYRVNPEQLAACDRLENNGRMYTRVERTFAYQNPKQGVNPEKGEGTTTAWVYLWNLERKNRPIPPENGVLVWDRAGQRRMRGPAI